MSPYSGGRTGGGSLRSLVVVPLGFIVGGLVLVLLGVDVGLAMMFAGGVGLSVVGFAGLLSRLL